jgi:hypothetical protein
MMSSIKSSKSSKQNHTILSIAFAATLKMDFGSTIKLNIIGQSWQHD